MIWASFLSAQLTANWVVQQQWTACFLSQTEPDCSQATKIHVPLTADPQETLRGWEASMSDRQIEFHNIYLMCVFSNYGKSISAREAIRPAVRGHRGPVYSTYPCCKYRNKYIKLKRMLRKERGRPPHKQEDKHSSHRPKCHWVTSVTHILRAPYNEADFRHKSSWGFFVLMWARHHFMKASSHLPRELALTC